MNNEELMKISLEDLIDILIRGDYRNLKYDSEKNIVYVSSPIKPKDFCNYLGYQDYYCEKVGCFENLITSLLFEIRVRIGKKAGQLAFQIDDALSEFSEI